MGDDPAPPERPRPTLAPSRLAPRPRGRRRGGARQSSRRLGRRPLPRTAASPAAGSCTRCCNICRRWPRASRSARRGPSSPPGAPILAAGAERRDRGRDARHRRDPRFAPLFRPGSLSEVPVVARIGEGEDAFELAGQIDRLAVLDDAPPHPRLQDQPAAACRRPTRSRPAYIAQLAAYRLALREAVPGPCPCGPRSCGPTARNSWKSHQLRLMPPNAASWSGARALTS